MFIDYRSSIVLISVILLAVAVGETVATCSLCPSAQTAQLEAVDEALKANKLNDAALKAWQGAYAAALRTAR